VDCGIRIGTVENPKIYGAGLLSSIGENCMTDQVEKNSRISALHKSLISAATSTCNTYFYIEFGFGRVC
jgi:phenylalanine-4-hydroxylase